MTNEILKASSLFNVIYLNRESITIRNASNTIEDSIIKGIPFNYQYFTINRKSHEVNIYNKEGEWLRKDSIKTGFYSENYLAQPFSLMDTINSYLISIGFSFTLKGKTIHIKNIIRNPNYNNNPWEVYFVDELGNEDYVIYFDAVTYENTANFADEYIKHYNKLFKINS